MKNIPEWLEHGVVSAVDDSQQSTEGGRRRTAGEHWPSLRAGSTGYILAFNTPPTHHPPAGRCIHRAVTQISLSNHSAAHSSTAKPDRMSLADGGWGLLVQGGHRRDGRDPSGL